MFVNLIDDSADAKCPLKPGPDVLNRESRRIVPEHCFINGFVSPRLSNLHHTMTSWTWGTVALSVTLAWVVNRWMRYQKELSRIYHVPGIRMWLDPYRCVSRCFLTPTWKVTGAC